MHRTSACYPIAPLTFFSHALVLMAAASAGCNTSAGGPTDADANVEAAANAQDAVVDTAINSADSVRMDTVGADTSTVDTGAADTGTVDSPGSDTGVAADTSVDAGAVDTSVDTNVADTSVDTGTSDAEMGDQGLSCSGIAECPPSPTACIVATCVANTCGVSNAGLGATCNDNGGAFCNGSGGCVQCNTGNECPSQTTECRTNTCSGNVCGVGNASMGSTCSDNGGAVCNGSGSCVQCNTGTDCPAQTTQCRTNSCSGNVCGVGNASMGSTCNDSGGRACNGTGTCVQCNTSADCPSGTCTAGACQAAVTYAANAQPIFAAKCAPCHTTNDAGGVNFASVYAQTQVAGNTAYCPAGDTVGACTLYRIRNGSMPYGAGCTGNPTTDAGNSACLTAAQQATLQAWITDGQLP